MVFNHEISPSKLASLSNEQLYSVFKKNNFPVGPITGKFSIKTAVKYTLNFILEDSTRHLYE